MPASYERLKRFIAALKEKHPQAIDLVEHYLEVHSPQKQVEFASVSPVVLPREVFDALALLAMIGMEATELEDK